MMRSSLWIVALLVGAMGNVARSESNWPNWRGPHYDGQTQDTNIPATWTKSDVAWKSPLPGRGQSCPVIWGERIFLTSASANGKDRIVLALNRSDGKILWEKVAYSQEAPEPLHKMNTWASPTCATDGQHVYAFFGRGGGLFCYTVDGELIWSKELGTFEGPWGVAASPLIFGDLVIQNCDADKNASIIALNKKTGDEIWKTPRPEIRGWSTPLPIRVDGHDEIVVNGHHGPKGYDPATGKELWTIKSFAGRGEPTLTPGPSGLLFVINGLRGDIYAVKPGGSGDATSTHMAWHAPRMTGRDLPSPIVVKNHVLAMSLQGGMLTSYDAETGKELWKERVTNNFAASPLGAGGKAYFVDEAGDTIVVDPTVAGESKITARNTIEPPEDEIFRAGLVPSEGQIFLRSDRALYCIGKRSK